ncbi:type II toxin-antitoxin system HicA family toxin [Acinetobacter baumannii]|uniref:type II toxin-antitoxin system HicA family toxin n=1 Tax=Acinetobacter baumannii TaxID=470 RepID=UPI0018AA95D2|nr:type II toxin-antitoxin system HicA family toxin [Acinetobacter baumannii]EKT8316677.1 type II toxin-antitoxin system HicA family toxin [Acinetobacter baumannii]EKU4658165.1 type II toxin-antitoxin system HicA family toxin [Acinetobacter baumannii]EKV5598980.1 type II toxin-antitoxin system HicA family toxin [Acinetobacter baumannii]EKV5699859.1 type II toxin-antitoxin system HicA family toxin [Acinetobacter baumannii]EKV6803108.1 type II toxin-antitoxin system HicA family toxin [Acinetobac
MSYNEFKRWLQARGVIFGRKCKGSHIIIELNGKKTVFPYHGKKEIPEGTRLKIKKDLGL